MKGCSAGTKVTIPTTYVSATAPDLAVSCPRMEGGNIIPALDNSYFGAMGGTGSSSLDWATLFSTVPLSYLGSVPPEVLGLTGIFPLVRAFNPVTQRYHPRIVHFYYFPYTSSFTRLRLFVGASAGRAFTSGGSCPAPVGLTANNVELAIVDPNSVANYQHGNGTADPFGLVYEYSTGTMTVSDVTFSGPAHDNRKQIEVSVGGKEGADSSFSACAYLRITQMKLEVWP